MANTLNWRLAWGVFVFYVSVHCAYPVEPAEALDRNWLITSLLNGSRLANRNIFDISFEREPSSTRLKAIWVASSDGLHRYDGYQWRRYTQADGLPSNFVRCVLVSRTGQLWIGTSEGAGVFDGRSFSRTDRIKVSPARMSGA